MAQGLVLLAYNAYYNRFLKFEASLADYITNSEGSDYLIQNVNFNPSDGLNTSHIIGKGELDQGLSFTDYSYTYALVIEYNSALKTRDEIYADENTKIISKWFILDNDRTRGGQYKIDLRRDVLVDYMKQIKTSPIFVEKGIISDFNSPLLMNNEDVRVNQIKKREILLKDKTNCAWLVLYLKKGVLGNNTIGPDNNGKIPIDIPNDKVYVYEELSTPITQWQYYPNTTTPLKVAKKHTFIVYCNAPFRSYAYAANSYGQGGIGPLSFYNYDTNLYADKSQSEYLSLLNSQFLSNVTTLITSANSVFNYAGSDGLSQYNGKIIKDSQGKYFKVTLSYSTTKEENKVTNAQSALKTLMTNYWNTALSQSASPNNNAFRDDVEVTSISVILEELTGIQTTIDFGAYTGKGTKDSALFDVICLPYGDLEMFVGTEVSIDTHATSDRSMKIMNSIATALTSQNVLDLQILPYCPCQNLVNDTFIEEGGIYVPEDEAGEILYASNNAQTTDILLICHSANFTLDIEQPITIEVWEDVSESLKMKYINDCTMLRICSPNYNGLFEMNLAKNGGSITSFNVDMTLRPFNPYIHVNPDFNFLYGQDFNDVRGLICNGDFSLGIINDAWNVYEIQNKNYQAIFDRQIQNLDVNNAIARQEAGWGAIAGVVSGAASGAAGGAIVGGGWGALAGAVIGAGASAVGGAMDFANLQKRQQENRSYAIDNYNLQLGNIRALPNSITKTSALTYNNKLFPFVEIYECSDEERLAYFDKIIWNGMTVGIIDRIEKYQSGSWANYFRGKLIALYGEEGSNSVENRIIEAINMEFMKGVFI